jgi:hypothetical protein
VRLPAPRAGAGGSGDAGDAGDAGGFDRLNRCAISCN